MQRLVLIILVLAYTLCLVSSPNSGQADTKTVIEFDAEQCVNNGQMVILATDRRDKDLPPLKVSLPVSGGVPRGAKLVRMFWNDANQCWCLVVTHPSYLKNSPVQIGRAHV